MYYILFVNPFADLDWDEGNLRHIEEDRGIGSMEVEEAVLHRMFVIRRRDRLVVAGKTEGGRFITVVLEQVRGGHLRPVTARQSDAKEVRRARELLARRGR